MSILISLYHYSKTRLKRHKDFENLSKSSPIRGTIVTVTD